MIAVDMNNENKFHIFKAKLLEEYSGIAHSQLTDSKIFMQAVGVFT